LDLCKALEEAKLVAELERLHAVERLRVEHQEAIRREREFEWDSAREQIKALKDSFAAEKARFQ